eukprot:11177218-Lingulodinium_polyedra.AAC.1
MEFVRKSGLVERASAVWEHAALCEALRYFTTWDQVECTGLVGVEVMIRRVIMIEMAVSRNPRAPDWDGLEMI